MKNILFATGIECSYPVVNGTRRDQLAETRHYENWRKDFELCREIGAAYVRYGPPYYKIHTGPHTYDWSFTDEVLPVMREMKLTPILDLCHFGVPDWAGNFQNEDWPELFADFAEAFAKRYPWISYYTPANEIFVCARFSAKLGWWNEQETSDRAMVMAHAHQCRTTLLTPMHSGILRWTEPRPSAGRSANITLHWTASPPFRGKGVNLRGNMYRLPVRSPEIVSLDGLLSRWRTDVSNRHPNTFRFRASG